MKKVHIERFEVGFSDSGFLDGMNQVQYTEDEAEASRRMLELHSQFMERLKTRTDVAQDRIEDLPNQGGADFKVCYPIPAKDSQGDPVFQPLSESRAS